MLCRWIKWCSKRYIQSSSFSHFLANRIMQLLGSCVFHACLPNIRHQFSSKPTVIIPFFKLISFSLDVSLECLHPELTSDMYVKNIYLLGTLWNCLYLWQQIMPGTAIANLWTRACCWQSRKIEGTWSWMISMCYKIVYSWVYFSSGIFDLWNKKASLLLALP